MIACACLGKSSRCDRAVEECSGSWSGAKLKEQALAARNASPFVRTQSGAQFLRVLRACCESKTRYFLTISAFSSMAMPPLLASLPFSVTVLPAYSASWSFMGL